jgi:hypothetical protein
VRPVETHETSAMPLPRCAGPLRVQLELLDDERGPVLVLHGGAHARSIAHGGLVPLSDVGTPVPERSPISGRRGTSDLSAHKCQLTVAWDRKHPFLQRSALRPGGRSRTRDCFVSASYLDLRPRGPCVVFRKHNRLAQTAQDHLNASPTCVRCRATATQADHIIAVALGGDLENGPFQSMCERCHLRRTAEDSKAAKRNAAHREEEISAHPSRAADRRPGGWWTVLF